MRTLNVHEGDKWTGFGIFLAFVVINWALVYFMIYTVRVKGWTFGIGTVVGALEKGVSWVGGLARSIGKVKAEGDGVKKENKTEQASGKGKEAVGGSE